MKIHRIKQSELPQNLWGFIDAALRDEPVFIECDGKAVVRLIPLNPVFRSRKAGSAKGMIKMTDDFDAPLDDFSNYLK